MAAALLPIRKRFDSTGGFIVRAVGLAFDESQVRDGFLRQVSMRRFVEAREVADLIVFLCSDAAAAISGQAIPVDGHTEGLSQS